MTLAQPFRLDAEAYWGLGRLLLGFGSIIAAQCAHLGSSYTLWSCIALVLCIWLEVTVGWYFRQHGTKSPATTAIEIYADVICFVAAPMALAAVLATAIWPLTGLPIFLLAAVYRLARFQVQGLVNNGYVGLPVTYNGYLFSLAALAIHFMPSATNIIVLILLLSTSGLMVSSRFIVPEF